jgi:outer membrane protein OmpA-like peptidoglycan-associated protein
MKKQIFFFLFSTITLVSFSQDEEETCPLPDNKKVQKLYEKSFDRKKVKDPDKRFLLLKEAVVEDDECVPCYWELAKRSFKRAKYQGLEYNGSRRYYTMVEKLCPDYHSDIYYFIGVMNYEEKNYKEAEKYFKKFIEFRSDDDKKFAKNYGDKLSAAKAILPELDFQNNFFGKPVPFDPTMVKNVSTKGDEYLPMISPDNELLFYTRVYEKKNLGDIVSRKIEELTISDRTSEKHDFNGGIPLPKPFNVGDNYGGVSISVDNKELFVCACSLNEKNYNNCDIFVTQYEYMEDPKTGKMIYKWSELVNLGAGVNGKNTWEAQPSISADGQTLYFATSRPQSKGQDIFHSKRQEDGTWGPAKSVGMVINSKGNDKAPFMHTDSRTLYFASQVSGSRRGAGDFDMFYSKQDDNGKWSKPKNLGYPINSERAEEGLIVSLNGGNAYFSSGRFSGGAGGKDIYTFELPEEAKPDKVVIVKGTMKDEKGDAIKDATFKLTYADSKKTEEVKLKSDDGKFALVVNMSKDDKVLITTKKKGHAFKSRVIETTDADEGGVVRGRDMKIEKVKVGKPYTINDINFATSSYEISDKVKFILTGFVDYLKENPSVKIAIQGHTDDLGDNGKNLKLSQNRADEVKRFLESKGIASSRLKAKGLGETKPKVKNSNSRNRAINRRTEFVITKL